MTSDILEQTPGRPNHFNALRRRVLNSPTTLKHPSLFMEFEIWMETKSAVLPIAEIISDVQIEYLTLPCSGVCQFDRLSIFRCHAMFREPKTERDMNFEGNVWKQSVVCENLILLLWTSKIMLVYSYWFFTAWNWSMVGIECHKTLILFAFVSD